MTTRPTEPSGNRRRPPPRRRWVGPLLAAAALAAGCTSHASAGPTPLPTPTFSCTPETSNDPPCTEDRAQQQAELDRNFAAAEKAYRDFTAERNRIGRAGTGVLPSATMRANADGPYLKEITGFLRALERNKVHWTTGATITYIRREPDVHRANSPPTELTLVVCEDGRRNRVVDTRGGLVSNGIAVGATLWVRPITGRMKVWDWDGKEVPSCAS